MLTSQAWWYAVRTSLSDLNAKHHLTNACSLAYSTLLSLIPLISIIIYIGSLSTSFTYMNDLARNYAIHNLLPSASAKVVTYIDTFSHQAHHIPTLSLFFLLITAILLMRSIDGAMVMVWDKGKRNKRLIPWLIYMLSIIAIPFIIAMVVMVSTLITNVMKTVLSMELIVIVIPLFVNAMMLYLLYQITAITRCRSLYLCYGALVAAILLEAAKAGFSLYITHYSNYQNLYGALSIIPVFLIWLFILWAIVIYGALFAVNLHRHAGQAQP